VVLMNIADSAWEDVLWDSARLRGCTVEQWDTIVQNLTQRLAQFCGFELVAETVDTVLDGEAVCVEVRRAPGRSNVLGLLDVDVEGTLGIDIGRGLQFLVEATLFVFVCGNRVARFDKKGDYLEFRYVRSADGRGQWTMVGWKEDEYGEFEGYFQMRNV